MSEQIYSDAEIVPDSFRQNFSDSSRDREGGVWGRSPEIQEDKFTQAAPLGADDALEILNESLNQRWRADAAEAAAAQANEERLETLGYLGAYETSEEWEQVANELLAAGGGDRMSYHVGTWAEHFPAEAEAWTAAAEHAVTMAKAQAGAQAAQDAQDETLAAYAQELGDFYRSRPDYFKGNKNDALAVGLAHIPTIGDSPQAFRQGIEYVREATDDLSKAAEATASELAFREGFKLESLRHAPMASTGKTERIAERAARPVDGLPQSMDELAGEIARRRKGTSAERQAALQARDAEFRAAFAEASRPRFQLP